MRLRAVAAFLFVACLFVAWAFTPFALAVPPAAPSSERPPEAPARTRRGGAPPGVSEAGKAPSSRSGAAADRLLAAAKSQIGQTVRYDPAYTRLAFPGGDPPRDRGVCSDVVIRAWRDAFGVDLQARVNADMRARFSEYPRRWGLDRPDPNIDHRRVPNLETFFRRHGQVAPVSDDPADYAPGDIVTQRLPGALPHIAIVAKERSADGRRPLVLHNIGAGARLEDSLFAFPIVGHFRFWP